MLTVLRQCSIEGFLVHPGLVRLHHEQEAQREPDLRAPCNEEVLVSSESFDPCFAYDASDQEGKPHHGVRGAEVEVLSRFGGTLADVVVLHNEVACQPYPEKTAGEHRERRNNRRRTDSVLARQVLAVGNEANYDWEYWEVKKTGVVSSACKVKPNLKLKNLR